jgi:hypothetical protein
LGWLGPVLVAIVMSSCASSAETSTPVDITQDYLLVVMGIADGQLINDLQAARASATERAKAECMVDRGFDYTAVPDDVLSPKGIPDLRFTDVEYARQFGFGMGTLDIQSPGVNPNDRTVAALSPSEQAAWVDAESSCLAEAEEEVIDTYHLDSMAQTASEVAARVSEDPRFIAEQQAWKACVQARGFEVDGDSFAELVSQFGERYASLASAEPQAIGAFLDEQRLVATAAAECGERMFEVQREVSKESLAGLDESLYQQLFGP